MECKPERGGVLAEAKEMTQPWNLLWFTRSFEHVLKSFDDVESDRRFSKVRASSTKFSKDGVIVTQGEHASCVLGTLVRSKFCESFRMQTHTKASRTINSKGFAHQVSDQLAQTVCFFR